MGYLCACVIFWRCTPAPPAACGRWRHTRVLKVKQVGDRLRLARRPATRATLQKTLLVGVPHLWAVPSLIEADNLAPLLTPPPVCLFV